MSLKTLSLTLALLTVPAAASAGSPTSDHDIFGHWYFSAEAALAEQGITASAIEEWGDVVRVETKNDAGKRIILFVDKDTLRPIG